MDCGGVVAFDEIVDGWNSSQLKSNGLWCRSTIHFFHPSTVFNKRIDWVVDWDNWLANNPFRACASLTDWNQSLNFASRYATNKHWMLGAMNNLNWNLNWFIGLSAFTVWVAIKRKWFYYNSTVVIAMTPIMTIWMLAF